MFEEVTNDALDFTLPTLKQETKKPIIKSSGGPINRSIAPSLLLRTPHNFKPEQCADPHATKQNTKRVHDEKTKPENSEHDPQVYSFSLALGRRSKITAASGARRISR